METSVQTLNRKTIRAFYEQHDTLRERVLVEREARTLYIEYGDDAGQMVWLAVTRLKSKNGPVNRDIQLFHAIPFNRWGFQAVYKRFFGNWQGFQQMVTHIERCEGLAAQSIDGSGCPVPVAVKALLPKVVGRPLPDDYHIFGLPLDKVLANVRHRFTNYDKLLKKLPACWLCAAKQRRQCKRHERAYLALRWKGKRIAETLLLQYEHFYLQGEFDDYKNVTTLLCRHLSERRASKRKQIKRLLKTFGPLETRQLYLDTLQAEVDPTQPSQPISRSDLFFELAKQRMTIE